MQPSQVSRLTALAADLDTLTDSTFSFWEQHGVDKECGGFHGTLNEAGAPTDPDSKGLVQTARHVYAFSTFHRHHPDQGSAAGMARSAFNFLMQHMRDPDTQLFHWEVSRDGSKVVLENKVLYGQLFAIYSLSTYAAVFGSQEALDTALACFLAADAAWYDARYLSWKETEGNCFPDTKHPSSSDQPKPTTLNTILHATEALCQLLQALDGQQQHRAAGTPVSSFFGAAQQRALVQQRLLQLLQLTCTQLITPAGVIATAYDPPAVMGGSWAAWHGSHVDWGHILEATWLISDTLDYLLDTQGISQELVSSYRAAIMGAAGKVLQQGGYDHTQGGLFEQGPLVTAAAAAADGDGHGGGDGGGAKVTAAAAAGLHSTDKIWWVQAETCLGLWAMYEYHNRDPAYLDLIAGTLEFIKSRLVDSMNGEWFWGVDADGQVLSLPGTVKGNKWKASYHNLRMLLLLRSRVGAVLKEATATAPA